MRPLSVLLPALTVGGILLCAAMSARAQNPPRFIQPVPTVDVTSDAMLQQSIRLGVQQGLEASRQGAEQESRRAALDHPPRSGFEAYCQQRFATLPPKTHYYSGSRNTKEVPRTAEEVARLKAQFREEYERMGTAERMRWEARVGDNDLRSGGSQAGAPITSSSALSTGGLGPDNRSASESVRQVPASIPAPAPAGPLPPRPATAAENQAAMARKYPALSVAGSPLNAEFVARYNSHKQTSPDYFNDPTWPVQLVEESLNALASGGK